MVLFVIWPTLMLTAVILSSKEHIFVLGDDIIKIKPTEQSVMRKPYMGESYGCCGYWNVIDDQQHCPHFKTMFIMDKYDLGASFYQLRRVIKDFVEELPDEIIFQVITINNERIEKFEFKRKEANSTWLEKIGASSSSRGVIKYIIINDEISNFFHKKVNQEMAEHIYLLVNEKTEIDNVKKFKEAMKHQKVQIVLYLKYTKLPCINGNLTKLSDHIHVLDGDTESKIKPIVQSVMRQTYIDAYETTPLMTGKVDNSPKDHVCCYIHPTINTILIVGCMFVFLFCTKRNKPCESGQNSESAQQSSPSSQDCNYSPVSRTPEDERKEPGLEKGNGSAKIPKDKLKYLFDFSFLNGLFKKRKKDSVTQNCIVLPASPKMYYWTFAPQMKFKGGHPSDEM